MTDILFNFFFFSCLILIQSFFLNSFGFYDILLPWIFYYYSVSEDKVRVFLLCALAGYLKDSLSGGVFGVYISTYLWFFLVLRLSSFFLNLNNRVFITFFGVLGVFINGFFLFVSNYKWFFNPVFLNEVLNLFFIELLCCFFSFFLFFSFFVKIRDFMILIQSLIKSKFAQLSRI
ncbi:MAG: hypothetical protein RBR08_09215 [Desulforegulaceae bacterium]|nr:hypothetical protein [Desulforegulaceae bacterium]